tara:strand:- start:199 stop:402 length:204 start_codon:yes stop_codon:yes gene_type:complete
MPFNSIKNIIETLDGIKEYAEEAGEKINAEIEENNITDIISRIPNPEVRKNMESLAFLVDRWKNKDE